MEFLSDICVNVINTLVATAIISGGQHTLQSFRKKETSKIKKKKKRKRR